MESSYSSSLSGSAFNSEEESDSLSMMRFRFVAQDPPVAFPKNKEVKLLDRFSRISTFSEDFCFSCTFDTHCFSSVPIL